MASPHVRALIGELASRIEEVIKQELREAIDHVGLGVERGSRRPVSAANGHRVLKSASRTKGAKRDHAELDTLAQRFTDFVARNPGLRIEQINKQLGTTTKDLALPIRRLVIQGTIKAHGQKRSTTYTVVGGKRRKK